MANLCKRVTVHATRMMSHGGEGLEIGGLIIFKTREAYDKMAKDKGWDKMDGKHGDSWCNEPVEFTATLSCKDAQRWKEGKMVPTERFLFSASDIDKLYKLGGWR